MLLRFRSHNQFLHFTDSGEVIWTLNKRAFILVLLAPQHPNLAQTPLAFPHPTDDTAHLGSSFLKWMTSFPTPSHHTGRSRINFRFRLAGRATLGPRESRPPIAEPISR